MILIFIVAVLIAVVLDPGVTWIQHHGVRHSFAVLAVAAMVLLPPAAFFDLLLPTMARQVRGSIRQLPQILHGVEAIFPAIAPLLARLGAGRAIESAESMERADRCRDCRTPKIRPDPIGACT